MGVVDVLFLGLLLALMALVAYLMLDSIRT